MNQHSSLLLRTYAIGAALVFGSTLWTPNAAGLPRPKYVDENTKYLLKYFSVQDIWVGWVAGVEDRPNIHVTTGRVVNSGKKAIIVTDVHVALLDPNGMVISDKRILNYPQRTPWQPQIGPGQEASFSAPLPPTDWTGEVRVSVMQIQVL